PFYNPPRGAEARRAHWVKPKLVAEVEFTEWTEDGTLRHPSFQGLRKDKKATDVVRERERSSDDVEPPSKGNGKASASAATRTKKGKQDDDNNVVAGVPLTNPDKVLYPEAKLTKRDLALYYATIGDWMLPQLRDRPLTLVRCPNGWQKCFYQKNADAST